MTQLGPYATGVPQQPLQQPVQRPQTQPGQFPGDPGLEYIELRDFTPGIFSSKGLPVQSAIDGAAQINGTYDCVALITGELTPGPRRTYRYNDTVMSDAVLKSGTNVPLGYESIRVQEFRNFSPVIGLDSISTPLTLKDEDVLPDQVFVGFDYFKQTSGVVYAQRLRVATYKFCQLTPSQTVPPELQSLAPSTYTLSTVDAGASTAFPGKFNGNISIDFSRSKHTAPTTPGFPIAGVAIWPAEVDGAGSVLIYYPDNATPTVDSTHTMAMGGSGGAQNPYYLIAHQDRVVGIALTGSAGSADQFGTGSGVRGEIVKATAVNDAETSSGIASGFVSESPYGVGTWLSSNASELLIIKQRGGGYLIRGDLANPIIVRLPGIASATPQHRGALTHFGFVYGNKRGVFLWPGGGDSSVCLSDQIDGFFWNPFSTLPPHTSGNGTDYEQRPCYGSFGYTYPYLFTPNNFIYDMRTAGWFKLSQPGKYPLMWFEASSNGNMLAAPTHIDDGDRLLVSWYDPNKGANSYQWTSQPLQRSRNRYLEFREIVLFGIGESAYVEVTITGIDGEEQTATFEFDSPSRRIALRQNLSVTGSDVVVTIAARSKDLTKAAPTVTLALGFGSGSRVTR